MLFVLKNRTYRHLFLAQVVSLLGTGLATVALGLQAFELAGGNAGVVLGTALAIRMIANVVVAPIATAFTEQFPRRAMLVTLDLIRAAVALCLPFITGIWQVYILIFLLQAASAAFTPTFQATIPDVLPDEDDYTSALSLSRLAYDLEKVGSPLLAAALLALMSYHNLYLGTVVGFLASASLVVSVLLPDPKPGEPRSIYDRTTRGIRLYLTVPRLRGLFALNLAVAAGGSMVFVNTVVLVQGTLGLGERYTAMALAAFGLGSMLAALLLPGLLKKIDDRPAMLTGTVVLVAALLVGLFTASYAGLIVVWAIIGVGYSLVLTPSGRILRRSAAPEDRPALFAAQFALSHGCWLITYPLAGWFGATAGIPATYLGLAIITALGATIAALLWPGSEEDDRHVHRNLAPDHPHLAGAKAVSGGHEHAHPIRKDCYHA
ncbi:MFS transporter [Shinella sumterensis]|uniref:MFS transporter n=1 Tax=Shinella sumterensis TaxID=1967501 RepID=UPI00106DE7C7|nr:MFS transporter [Shinella sumterensis]MCD1266306.1 MFS transporter [Shinella sumterensis]TFE96989.1 MFS transporter [Shinella sumterensis]